MNHWNAVKWLIYDFVPLHFEESMLLHNGVLHRDYARRRQATCVTGGPENCLPRGIAREKWVVWKCCVSLNPMVLLIIIPFLNGYFIGNIPYFQTNPHSRCLFCKLFPSPVPSTPPRHRRRHRRRHRHHPHKKVAVTRHLGKHIKRI